MATHQSLMDELEEAVQSGSRDRRIDTLRRITDLFLVAPAQLNAEQVGVFDDVLTHLVERVETRARAELAKRLAPIDHAPNDVVQRLARDDEISVAGPILAQSKRLSTADLVDIAQQKGQAHLLAIATREQIAEQVTDVLVHRGDRDVVHTLASNAGAAFSQDGYSRLVSRAKDDDGLVEKLGRRLDIPLQLFRDLLARATETVRARLLAAVSPERQDQIRTVLAEISAEMSKEAPVAQNHADAQRLVQLLQETGRLNASELLAFAKQGKIIETLAALAALCAAPLELIERLAGSGQTSALIVPCKAAGLSWPAARAVIELNSANVPLSEIDLDTASKEFIKLSKATAARVLRFWQVRQTTVAAAAE